MAKERFIPVAEAAKRKGCSRQAIHAAIKAKRVTSKAKAVSTVVWLVGEQSLAKLTINPKMKRPNGRNGNARQLCPGCCEGELTSADREAGECTQCRAKL